MFACDALPPVIGGLLSKRLLTGGVKALIEEVRSFRKVRSIKIIIALRKDLLNKVFDETRSSGFQEEKYDDYILDLRWTETELRQIVNSRLAKASQIRAQSNKIALGNIMPVIRGEKNSFQYILDRTFLRPRDCLQYMNELLKASVDQEKITWKTILATETIYSKKRLDSLFEEWELIYPALKHIVKMVQGISESFCKSDLSESRLLEVISSIDKFSEHQSDPVAKLVLQYLDHDSRIVSEKELITMIIQTLYHVGVIGIKLRTNESFSFSFKHQPIVKENEIEHAEHFRISKIYLSALDIKLSSRSIAECTQSIRINRSE